MRKAVVKALGEGELLCVFLRRREEGPAGADDIPGVNGEVRPLLVENLGQIRHPPLAIGCDLAAVAPVLQVPRPVVMVAHEGDFGFCAFWHETGGVHHAAGFRGLPEHSPARKWGGRESRRRELQERTPVHTVRHAKHSFSQGAGPAPSPDFG